jgi:hypothetical protein
MLKRRSGGQELGEFVSTSNTSSKHELAKKFEKNMKKPFFFTLNPYPRPSTESVFVQIILPSKWTGVSLKGYRWNWQETVPGEETLSQCFLKYL